VIPDEQEAIDAALKLGKPGDLVLVFADALTRSWKQVIKFHPEGGPTEKSKPKPKPAVPAELHGESGADGGFDASRLGSMEGLIRDERGIRIAPEGED
jgi:cyanophycin synthetase